MWVMANVFADDLRDVGVGQSVDVLTDASRTPLPGRVDYIAALADPGTKAVTRPHRRAEQQPRAPARHVRARRDQVARRASRHSRAASRRCCATIRTCRSCSSIAATMRFARRRIDLGTRVGDQYESRVRARGRRQGGRERRALPSVRGKPMSDPTRPPRDAAADEQRRGAARGCSATRRSGGQSAAARRHSSRSRLIGVGIYSLTAAAGRRLSRRVTDARRDDDAVARPRRRGSRATDHRSDRDGAQRTAEPRRHAIRVALRSLEHSRHVHRQARISISLGSRCSSDSPARACPTACSTDVEAPFSPSGLVYRYVIQSTDRSAMDLHVLQDWVLDKAFRAVPGVADVASLGGETMQYQVLVDPTKLAGAGLVDQRRERRRSARTTATAAAASSPRAGSSSTCAASVASSRSRTSATSSSP